MDPTRVVDPAIEPEATDHDAAIRQLLDRAFGPGRHAKAAERIREQVARPAPALSRVALAGDRLIGCCRIFELGLAGRRLGFLGPLAVDPSLQANGLGLALTRAALQGCAAQGGLCAVLLIGAPALFQRLGFAQVPPGRVLLPAPVEPRRVQWLALRDGALEGLSGALTPPPAATPA